MAEEQAEQSQEVELKGESRKLLSNAESVAHSTFENLQDIGDKVDVSEMTLVQLREEVRKMRRDHESFRFEIRKFISNEVEKHLAPIVEALNKITTKNPRIIYVKFKFPLFDIFPKIYAKLFKR